MDDEFQVRRTPLLTWLVLLVSVVSLVAIGTLVAGMWHV